MSGFSVFHWVIVFIVVGLFLLAVRGLVGFGAGRSSFCTSCGHEGEARAAIKGNILIEIILWLCFLVPGLVYSLWRIGSRHQVCSSCGARTLVPLDSPVAKAQRRALAVGSNDDQRGV